MTAKEFESFMKGLIIQSETAENLTQLRLIIRSMAPKECVEEVTQDIAKIRAAKGAG